MHGTTSGILLVDKPGGMTSHDVVARVRRALGTRKVGHAGTLDPMATGLLVVGVDDATRLLTFFVGLDKTYTATIALGARTVTDDAEGEVLERRDASAVTREQVVAGIAGLTGAIEQVPSAVSAIKVNGERAYARVRQGEDVTLPARPVTVSRFDLDGWQQGSVATAQVTVDCSSGTYIRALARDLGHALGVGGHLTALRRTAVGPWSITDATDIDALSRDRLIAPVVAAGAVLPRIGVTDAHAADLRHGRRIALAVDDVAAAAAIDPAGALIGIIQIEAGRVKVRANMPETVRVPEVPA